MPDDYPWWPGGQRAVMPDMAELAARLGSPVLYDRRGQVIWFDHAQHGMAPWTSFGIGTGAATKVVNDVVYHGGFALELTAPSDNGSQRGIQRFFNTPEANKLGICVAVGFLADFDWFGIGLDYEASSYSYTLAAFLDLGDLAIYIADNLLGMVKVATLTTPVFADGRYEVIKIVGDFGTGKYVRLLYNDMEYDISAYTMDTGAGSATPDMKCELTLQGRAANLDQANIGLIVLTAGEP
jgi:hypothetical protein